MHYRVLSPTLVTLVGLPQSWPPVPSTPSAKPARDGLPPRIWLLDSGYGGWHHLKSRTGCDCISIVIGTALLACAVCPFRSDVLRACFVLGRLTALHWYVW